MRCPPELPSWIRRFELAGVLFVDLDLDDAFLTVWAKAINRKGRRPQRKKLLPHAVEAAQYWLEVRPFMASEDCPTIFWGEHGEPLTLDGIECLFKRLNAKLNFPIYAHMLRGGRGNERGQHWSNDRLVMAQGGWESWEMFRGYTEEASLNAFVNLMPGKRNG